MERKSKQKSGRLSVGNKTLIATVIALGVFCVCIFGFLVMNEDSSAGEDEFTVGDLKYVITSEAENLVEVEDYKGSAKELIIPDSVEFKGKIYTVTSLGEWMAFNCKSIRTLVIPETVISIYKGAFYGCTEITNLTLPISINAAAYHDYPVFGKCTKLEMLTFTKGTGEGFDYSGDKYTGKHTFQHTPWYDSWKSLKTVVFCDGIRTIGKNTLRDCTYINKITIGEGLEEIHEGAFRNLEDLRNLDIPSTVTVIGKNAFQDCEILKSLVIPQGVTRIEENTFYNCKLATSINIPENVTYLGEHCFYNCKLLTTAFIPDKIVEIDDCCFENCVSVTDISFPISLDVVRYGVYVWGPVFQNCTGIENITVTPGTGTPFDYYEESEDQWEQLPWTISKSLKTVTICEGVTSIGPGTFNKIEKIITLTLPNSLETIPNHAFKNYKFYDSDDKTKLKINPDNLRGCVFKGSSERMVKQATE